MDRAGAGVLTLESWTSYVLYLYRNLFETPAKGCLGDIQDIFLVHDTSRNESDEMFHSGSIKELLFRDHYDGQEVQTDAVKPTWPCSSRDTKRFLKPSDLVALLRPNSSVRGILSCRGGCLEILGRS